MTPRQLAELPTWRVLVAMAESAAARVRRLLASNPERSYDIAHVTSAAAAVAAVARGGAAPVDCLLSADQLEDADSLTLLAALRGSEGRSPCAVVVLGDEENYERARTVMVAGAQDYVDPQPLTARRLSQLLEHAVERWRLGRALRAREQAVIESEERLRLTLDAANIGLWTWDLASDGVTWSPECYQIHGLSEREFDHTGAGFFRLVYAQDRAQVQERIELALQQQAMFECEFRVHRADGSLLWVANRGRATYDKDGKAVLVRGIIADISKRRRAADSLARSEQFSRSIVEASADCVAGLDRDGRLRWMNSNGQRMLQITNFEALRGTPWVNLWATGDSEAPAQQAVASAQAGQVGRFRGQGAISGGQVRWWDTVITPIGTGDDAGDAVIDELLAVARDVTEARAAEQQAEQAALDAAAAAEANAKFKFFFEQGTHFAGLLDLDGNLREANRTCFEACGYLPSVELGRPFWECGWWNRSEAQMAKIREAVQRALAGSYVRMETSYFLADGTERFVDLTLAQVTDDQGRIMYIAPTGVDITERKQTQEALALREEEFRTLADHMSQLAWMTDATGWIYWYNRRWFDYTGTTIEQMQGWGWRDVHHPAHVEHVVAKISEHFKTGEHWEDLFPLRGADGQFRWFLSRAVPIRNEDGQIIRWLGTNTDVTDRQLAEERLRARERELQTLTDNTPDILIRFDPDFRQVFVNSAAERAAGRSRTELLGKSFRALDMAPALCELWEKALTKTFISGVPRAIEFDVGDDGDDRRTYAARLVPEVDDSGAVAFVLAVAHDITAQKRHEQGLAEQDRRKDEFLATLAHELRTPLAPLRSGLTVLRNSRSAQESERAIGMMERQVAQLVDLVEDLLDISRISQGKITLRNRRMMVREAVEAAVESCQAVLEAKSHSLSVELPEQPLPVIADRTRLVQVLVNLITNAAKYSDPGGRIEVEVSRQGDEVAIAVTDFGVGISAEALPLIWDMFAQVRDTLDKAQGGLGIGLSLVKRLVTMHGGSVSVASAGVGRGSVFTVRLPLASADELGDEPADAPLPEPATARVARRVIVVDDNQDSADVLAMVLEHAGHEVSVAYDGLSAIELAQTFSPEVMLVDIGLPGLNGYDVARRLRGDPATTDVLLIALTGWGSDEDRRRAAEAGFDVHFTKPVDTSELRRMLLQGRQPVAAR